MLCNMKCFPNSIKISWIEWFFESSAIFDIELENGKRRLQNKKYSKQHFSMKTFRFVGLQNNDCKLNNIWRESNEKPSFIISRTSFRNSSEQHQFALHKHTAQVNLGTSIRTRKKHTHINPEPHRENFIHRLAHARENYSKNISTSRGT